VEDFLKSLCLTRGIGLQLSGMSTLVSPAVLLCEEVDSFSIDKLLLNVALDLLSFITEAVSVNRTR